MNRRARGWLADDGYFPNDAMNDSSLIHQRRGALVQLSTKQHQSWDNYPTCDIKMRASLPTSVFIEPPKNSTPSPFQPSTSSSINCYSSSPVSPQRPSVSTASAMVRQCRTVSTTGANASKHNRYPSDPTFSPSAAKKMSYNTDAAGSGRKYWRPVPSSTSSNGAGERSARSNTLSVSSNFSPGRNGKFTILSTKQKAARPVVIPRLDLASSQVYASTSTANNNHTQNQKEFDSSMKIEEPSSNTPSSQVAGEHDEYLAYQLRHGHLRSFINQGNSDENMTPEADGDDSDIVVIVHQPQPTRSDTITVISRAGTGLSCTSSQSSSSRCIPLVTDASPQRLFQRQVKRSLATTVKHSPSNKRLDLSTITQAQQKVVVHDVGGRPTITPATTTQGMMAFTNPTQSMTLSGGAHSLSRNGACVVQSRGLGNNPTTNPTMGHTTSYSTRHNAGTSYTRGGYISTTGNRSTVYPRTTTTTTVATQYGYPPGGQGNIKIISQAREAAPPPSLLSLNTEMTQLSMPKLTSLIRQQIQNKNHQQQQAMLQMNNMTTTMNHHQPPSSAPPPIHTWFHSSPRSTTIPRVGAGGLTRMPGLYHHGYSVPGMQVPNNNSHSKFIPQAGYSDESHNLATMFSTASSASNSTATFKNEQSPQHKRVRTPNTAATTTATTNTSMSGSTIASKAIDKISRVIERGNCCSSDKDDEKVLRNKVLENTQIPLPPKNQHHHPQRLQAQQQKPGEPPISASQYSKTIISC